MAGRPDTINTSGRTTGTSSVSRLASCSYRLPVSVLWCSPRARVAARGGECDWENLSFLVVLCHMVLPLFSLPLVYLLIPDKTMHVEVLTEADTVDFDPAPDAPRPVQASSSDKSA